MSCSSPVAHCSRDGTTTQIKVLSCLCKDPSWLRSADSVATLSTEFEECLSLRSKAAVIAKTDCIQIGYLDVITKQRTPTAGIVLRHCKDRIQRFRADVGFNVCVFKIGFTSNPIFRFAKYSELNYSRMLLIHVTQCKGTAQMLEAALIDRHLGDTGCRNEQPGGEGPGHISASYYYVYVVGARADLPLPIG